MSMDCPQCGLINVPETLRCDCGHIFASQRSADDTIPTQPPSTPQRSSYLVRHWRGELSLARSYWLNTSLLSTVFGLAVNLLSLLDITTHPRGYSLLIVAMWIVVFMIIPWQLVGLWRSAANYIKEADGGIWGRVVQVLVVLGVLYNLNILLNTAIPQVREYARIALGTDGYSRYRLRVLRQGTEIEVSGAIGFGLTDDMVKHLDANASIRVIHLNSPGGRIAEARRLRDLIAARRLVTYSSEDCHSACVIAFMGGTTRVLRQGAKLGFHRWSFPGTTSEELDSEMRKERLFLVSVGVKSQFVDRAFATPADGMWTPSVDELLRAGVITHVSDGSQFGMSEARSWSDRQAIDKALVDIPFYQSLKRHDPKAYGRILAQLESSAKEGDSERKRLSRREHM